MGQVWKFEALRGVRFDKETPGHQVRSELAGPRRLDAVACTPL